MTIATATRTTGGPVRPSSSKLRPLSQQELRITGGFWAERQQLNATAIISHCETWMERMGWMANFDRAAAGTVAQEHAGIEFVDSEVYKLLEAMAWELGRSDDEQLRVRYLSLVQRVASAQEDDGYLHTSFGRPGQRSRYSDLERGHELYCFGHLIQAAVARLRTGNDDLLVEVARRLADHVYREFGPDGRDAVCGHPEIEPALAELSRATGVERYLELARLLIERRGHGTLATTLFQGHEYFQDDVPVREASVLRGHAVRALYLSSGAVDVAVETGDAQLLAAVETQWANTVARRTYLTGGMGSHHQNEEFGSDFELPADRSYSETCASIASVMLSWRLLLQSGESKYADLIERTLLNGVLVSPREDGRAFYYANTLHQREHGTETHDDELSERAEASLRAPWFEVSCCPTNVARTLASVSSYFATTDESGVQLHQYGDLAIDTVLPDGERVALRVETGYPTDAGVEVVIEHDAARPVTVALRIPAWATGASLSVNGESQQVDGPIVVLERIFRAGDRIRLVLPLEPRVTTPHPAIDAVRGQVAVERGPFVLALEDIDLPESVDVEHVAIDPSTPPLADGDGATVAIRVRSRSAEAWPYGVTGELAPDAESVRLIPYYQWANRGPSTMRVWIPAAQRVPTE